MTDVSDPGPPLTMHEIEQVEKKLNVSFPADYKAFLLKNNGGVPSPGDFDCLDGESSAVAWFYSIEPKSESDILFSNNMRKGRLPKGFVAIASDGGGNEICLDCKPGPQFGCVYFWDHEMEADCSAGMKPENAGNTHLIANSFSKLIDCLYDAPTPEIPDELRGTGSTPPENEGILEALMKRKGLL